MEKYEYKAYVKARDTKETFEFEETTELTLKELKAKLSEYYIVYVLAKIEDYQAKLAKYENVKLFGSVKAWKAFFKNVNEC